MRLNQVYNRQLPLYEIEQHLMAQHVVERGKAAQ